MIISKNKKNQDSFESSYIKDGFSVKNIFDKESIDNFVLTFHDLLKLQMKKLSINVSDDLDKDLLAIQKRSNQCLNEVLLMARHTSAGHNLASKEKLAESSFKLLATESDLSEKNLIISGPSFFVNIPNNNERKYTWHSEQNWYPKRRNFLNVWCPIILDRTSDNSMAIMAGSHKKDWIYFSENTGYDGVIDETSNVQYEIPTSFLSSYKEYIPAVKIGEGLFFNGKSVHRSLDNTSSKTLFTMVFRVFDYSEDLTLSSNWADIPYNRKSISIPEINVKP